jgi:hypothetical protein
MARVVNELIRAGLTRPPPARRRRYRLKHTFSSEILVGSLDNVAEVLELAETGLK